MRGVVKLHNVVPVYSFTPDVKLVGLQVVTGGLYQVWDVKNKIDTLISYFEEWLLNRHSKLMRQTYVTGTLVTDHCFDSNANVLQLLNQ